MTDDSAAPKTEWSDPDDAPEWTDAMFEIAEHRINGNVIRPGTGTLAKDGVRLGRPSAAWRKSKSPCASTPT